MVAEINFLSVNIRSLRAHYADIKCLISSHESDGLLIDILILTESWISEVEQAYYNIDGHEILCSNKLSKKGKGTVIYIKKGITCNRIEFKEIDNCDMVVVKCSKGLNHINIVGIYRNHISKIDTFVEKFEDLIIDLTKNHQKLVILGDMN